MEIAYNNNEGRKFYQEAYSIRKGIKLQTLPITDKEVKHSKQQRESPAKLV
jgi:hypothetical protein